jgi:inosine-uridine nucleoside N-ribohydrolase
MQFPGQGKPPVGIIFDTTMGRSIDEALALALLYGFDGKKEARLVSVSISNPDLKAAAFCDAVGKFYAGATNPEVRAFFRGLPIGLSTDRKVPSEDTPMLSAPLAKAPYSHEIQKLNDTAEPTALIRNAFTAQHDQNAIAVLAGPATNLVKVLDLPGAKELIANKARLLCFVTSEFNLKTDTAAAKRLFAEWPTPIVAAGPEIGDALLFPASSIEKDFAWSTAHPIADAYRAYKAMPYDAPTWDMTAVLYAVRPKEGYFTLSGPGVISMTDDGRTKFTPATEGKHQFLVLDPAQKERIIKVYTEVASAKPVPRQPRFQLDKKKEDAPKPPEAKPPEAKPQAPAQ